MNAMMSKVGEGRMFVWVALLRAFFEFIFPIVIGIVAIWILLTAKTSPPSANHAMRQPAARA